MPTLKNIRFHKRDRFNNFTFICNKAEPDAYKILKRYAKKLKRGFQTYLPIYYSPKYHYAVITFKNTPCYRSTLEGFNLAQGDSFNIEFNIHTNEYKGKVYVTADLINVELVKKSTPPSLGVEIILTDSDESSDCECSSDN